MDVLLTVVTAFITVLVQQDNSHLVKCYLVLHLQQYVIA